MLKLLRRMATSLLTGVTAGTTTSPSDDVEPRSSAASRPKTPPAAAGTVPLTAASSDAAATLQSSTADSEQRVSTQTEGIFRRFVEEMDSRRGAPRVGRPPPADHDIASDILHGSSASHHSSSSPSSLAADEDDDDQLLS